MWLTRAALFLVALVGTAAYAASFALPGASSGPVAGAAAGVGAAAALSWPLFGAALLWLTRARPSPWAWADACLRTMAAGIAVLAVAALGNFGIAASGGSVPPRAFLAAHAAVLLAGNVLMGFVFARHAALLGLPPRVAAAAWVLALDAPFAALAALFAMTFNLTGVM